MDQTVKLRGISFALLFLLFIGITHFLSAQGMYAEHRTQGTYFQFPSIIPFHSRTNEARNTLYEKPFVSISSHYNSCLNIYINDSLIDQLSLNEEKTIKYRLPLKTSHFWPDSSSMNRSYRIEASLPINVSLHYPTSDTNDRPNRAPTKLQRSCTIALQSPINTSKGFLIIDSPLGDRDNSAFGVGAISIVQSSTINLITLIPRL